MKKILVIMAKEPEAGKVKTRLCPPLTQEQAAELYKCFLVDKITAGICLTEDMKEISLALAVDPPTGKSFLKDLVPAWTHLVAQKGRDLGERQRDLFDHFFKRGFGQVVITDSDSPTLPLEYLKRPFELLESTDMVLGPSQDGGYYLVGLNNPQPGLFSKISWSTDLVLEQTMARAKKRNLEIKSLPPWYDVDTPQDLEKLQSEMSSLSLEELRFIKATKDFLQSSIG